MLLRQKIRRTSGRRATERTSCPTAGVSSRLAPYDARSAARRSPEASMASLRAVAPRVPRATAGTARSLRRVPRRNDSISRRPYIVGLHAAVMRRRPAVGENRHSGRQVGDAQQELIAVAGPFQRYGVAAAVLTDAGRIDG